MSHRLWRAVTPLPELPRVNYFTLIVALNLLLTYLSWLSTPRASKHSSIYSCFGRKFGSNFGWPRFISSQRTYCQPTPSLSQLVEYFCPRYSVERHIHIYIYIPLPRVRCAVVKTVSLVSKSWYWSVQLIAVSKSVCVTVFVRGIARTAFLTNYCNQTTLTFQLTDIVW